MRLNTYLLTEGRTKKISEKEFFKGIEKKCSEILNIYKKIDLYYYRGITNDFGGNFGFVRPSKFTRESAWASNNAYTLIIDNIDSFKKYPKRSKSIVMTTDKWNAQSRGHGSFYAVLPVNGSKIGMCPYSDIWESFPELFKKFGLNHLNHFNEMLSDLEAWITNENKYDFNNWKDLKKFLQLVPFEKIDKSLQEYLSYNFYIDAMKSLGDQIIPFFDPKINGFKLLTTKDRVPLGNKEIWTDGDCYLIDDMEILEDYLEILKIL